MDIRLEAAISGVYRSGSMSRATEQQLQIPQLSHINTTIIRSCNIWSLQVRFSEYSN
jgi:hypothetical protein